MIMPKYSFNIAWSEDDSEYLATCPSFQGLSAFGETEEEALNEAKIALQLFIESYEEREIPLPEPRTSQAYSGQLRLRLSKSLHQRAAKMASDDGISLNQYITNAVNREVSGEEVGKQCVEEIRRVAASARPPEFKPIDIGQITKRASTKSEYDYH